MSLIKCPECGKEISDKAEKCPNCACPISLSPAENYVQTIEQTGKSLKLQKVISIIMALVGAGLIGSEKGGMQMVLGWAMLDIGILWFIVIKIAIWWNHK